MIEDHHANAVESRAYASCANPWNPGDVNAADAAQTASAANVARRRNAAPSMAIVGGAAAALGQVPVLINDPRRGRALLGFLKLH